MPSQPPKRRSRNQTAKPQLTETSRTPPRKQLLSLSLGDLDMLPIHAAEHVVPLQIVGRMPVQIVADGLVGGQRLGVHPPYQSGRVRRAATVPDQRVVL